MSAGEIENPGTRLLWMVLGAPPHPDARRSARLQWVRGVYLRLGLPWWAAFAGIGVVAGFPAWLVLVGVGGAAVMVGGFVHLVVELDRARTREATERGSLTAAAHANRGKGIGDTWGY
jgi:hypothetical protein